jgi:hypothetical protein
MAGDATERHASPAVLGARRDSDTHSHAAGGFTAAVARRR